MSKKATSKAKPKRTHKELLGGRPTAYDPAYVEQARKLCKLGAKDEEVADFFKVSVRTLFRWKNAHPEFCHVLKVAKEEADSRVERSLYERATGYTYTAEKIFNDKGRILRAKVREHAPPDTTAMIFWLKNRRPDIWRDRVEHSGRIDGPVPVINVVVRPPSQDGQ